MEHTLTMLIGETKMYIPQELCKMQISICAHLWIYMTVSWGPATTCGQLGIKSPPDQGVSLFKTFA